MTDIPVKVAEARSFRQRRAFLNFPFKLYKDDPYWVPNIRMDEKGLVGFSKNPFYERNSCQAFLAYRGKEVVGRIVAILNVGHLERYHDGVGFFGFFESIDDQAVADALFDACAAGRLLILSPWSYDGGKRHIRRSECVALNSMAEEICKELN